MNFGLMNKKLITVLSILSLSAAVKAELVADLDPAMMRAKLYDFVDGTTEARALEALRSAMAEIGDKPVSEYMTGPYWEMTNVKAAAILKSKKYSWIDDYAIYNHYNALNLSLIHI